MMVREEFGSGMRNCECAEGGMMVDVILYVNSLVVIIIWYDLVSHG